MVKRSQERKSIVLLLLSRNATITLWIYTVTISILSLPSLSCAYHCPQPPPAIVRNVSPAESSKQIVATNNPSLLWLMTFSEPPIVQTQSEQMRNAMPLKTMRGTQWRILEDRKGAMSLVHQPRQCTSTAIFRGFEQDANKGIMKFDSSCAGEDSSFSTLSSGRWITKPSEIRQGAVQLSARWKVKLPAGRFIYKGFIQAGSTIGKNGAISATMTGVILTGEEVGKESVVGKFRADLVQQQMHSSFEEEKIGFSDGSIRMTPR